ILAAMPAPGRWATARAWKAKPPPRRGAPFEGPTAPSRSGRPSLHVVGEGLTFGREIICSNPLGLDHDLPTPTATNSEPHVAPSARMIGFKVSVGNLAFVLATRPQFDLCQCGYQLSVQPLI